MPMAYRYRCTALPGDGFVRTMIMNNPALPIADALAPDIQAHLDANPTHVINMEIVQQ